MVDFAILFNPIFLIGEKRKRGVCVGGVVAVAQVMRDTRNNRQSIVGLTSQ